MSKLYFDDDANLSLLEGKTIAILGYGNQGRSQALNMRDSGSKVIVGSRADSSGTQAKEDGFEVYSYADAAKHAQIIFVLLPDEVQAEIYATLQPNLEEHDVLVFAHGYNIFYGFITPAANLDVVMLAPRMIGHGVRSTYLEGQGFPSLVAVEQDASGQALDRVLALAKAIGSTRMGAIMSSFEEETVVDLFAEHLAPLYAMRRHISALSEAGYNPWVAILEFYASGESVEIAKAYVEKGMWGQIETHSGTSQYGQEVTGRLNREQHSNEMNRLADMIDNIKTGAFAKEWALERQADTPNFRRVRAENLKHPVHKAEQELYKILGRSKPQKDD